ncbi:LytR/AlgR family response regulator transcription factor [Pedobacter mucosus]|uniref:LytR/AlgR family response regulator transcription factor n=1 Tax=Pedobacter mucosus TaxID=2895286 RepID=UPI001EE46D46|nr:LytTR family DNA-binding domain-containing protein [Pedobacter mucosus]UKT64994.1 LytTR family DNA-binding domain-containing protein [Pedobacter mucosus]
MKVIIIEDEIRTANELRGMLLGIDNEIQVEAVLRSVASALEWLQANPMPELIFSDIELGDGLSFEIFRKIAIEVPVIFCTAFDEYAIRAFESNSIDYILKPLDEAMLQKSLEKYIRFKDHLIASAQHAQNLDRAITQIDAVYQQTLLVNYREKIIPIKLSDVALVYAANGAVYLHTGNDKNFAVQYTMEQLELMLEPRRFFRANRQFILNRDFIEDIEYYFNRKLLVSIKTGSPEKIIVSKVKSQPFLKWMET